MGSDPFVLLVEDNQDDIDLTLLAFEQENFSRRIEVARDGQAALDLLRAADAAPLMVILDIKMPRVGGLEVLRTMRAEPKLRGVKAVFLTSSDEERDRAAAEELGAARYLRKPMGFPELRAIIGELKALLE